MKFPLATHRMTLSFKGQHDGAKNHYICVVYSKSYMPKMAKHLYIIAGCNGAGKTTASYSVLPYALHVTEFVNADEIAKGLSPFNPDSMALLAGRLMLQRINELLYAGKTFAVETTLATRSYINLIKEVHRRGYLVHILFFFLEDVSLAKKRVAKRVAMGGHNIPEDVIERRYLSGLHNLFNLFIGEVDTWIIFDNSHQVCQKVASGGKNCRTEIIDPVKFEYIKTK